MTTDSEVHLHWNRRAKLGRAAGTNDLILKQLEIDAISKHVRDGMRILDAGCGNGITAIKIAEKFNVNIEGFDFAEKMVEMAQVRAADANLKGSLSFEVADLLNIPNNRGKFDLIYSERALINLKDWPEQKRVIANLCQLLNGGGCYLMCENSQDGLDRINHLRELMQLSPIEPPWHNRYLLDDEIETLVLPGVRLESVDHFTSTYYFLSRVVNAAMAAQENKEPDYDAPVNKLALTLPPLAEMGQTRIWLWRK